jgi:hypothetical protein
VVMMEGLDGESTKERTPLLRPGGSSVEAPTESEETMTMMTMMMTMKRGLTPMALVRQSGSRIVEPDWVNTPIKGRGIGAVPLIASGIVNFMVACLRWKKGLTAEVMPDVMHHVERWLRDKGLSIYIDVV